METNEVQNYIDSKFETFAQKRGLKINGHPCLCHVKIFSSKKKTQCIAVHAMKDNEKGYIINLGRRKLAYYSEDEASCLEIKNGKVTLKADNAKPIKSPHSRMVYKTNFGMHFSEE